jgi:hypothetical protein
LSAPAFLNKGSESEVESELSEELLLLSDDRDLDPDFDFDFAEIVFNNLDFEGKDFAGLETSLLRSCSTSAPNAFYSYKPVPLDPVVPVVALVAVVPVVPAKKYTSEMIYN